MTKPSLGSDTSCHCPTTLGPSTAMPLICWCRSALASLRTAGYQTRTVVSAGLPAQSGSGRVVRARAGVDERDRARQVDGALKGRGLAVPEVPSRTDSHLDVAERKGQPAAGNSRSAHSRASGPQRAGSCPAPRLSAQRNYADQDGGPRRGAKSRQLHRAPLFTRAVRSGTGRHWARLGPVLLQRSPRSGPEGVLS